MAQLVTDALVLRRTEYRDYDRMVVLLTPTHGRIDAIARGCRRPKSPLMNATELFCAGQYTINVNRERYAVNQCQIHENYYALREDYDRLVHGAYILHLLLLAAMPDQPNETLFQLALKTFAYLNYSELPPALITFAFEMHYMMALGQSPVMDGCAQCGRQVDGDARFDAALGGVVCGHCMSQAPYVTNGARRILLRAPRTRFDAFTLLNERSEWPEAAEAMRAFIARRIDASPKSWPELQNPPGTFKV